MLFLMPYLLFNTMYMGMQGPTVSPPPPMLLAVYFPSLSFHRVAEMQKQDHRAGN